MEGNFPHNLLKKVVEVRTSSMWYQGTFSAIRDWGGEIFFEITNNEEPTYVNINCIHSIKEKK